MSPRAYDRRLRRAAAEEARRRIVEAAAALHAKHGGRGTSHAMIARKAGVSIPTVYKYFPTANHLVPACTGLVAGRAPVLLGETLFKGLDGIPARIRELARALFRLHEYFAPWLRWSAADAAAFPALRGYLNRVQEHQRAIIRRALTPEKSKSPPEMLVRLARILLDVPSWRTLTEAGRSSDQAAAAAADAILAIQRTYRFSKGKP
jgi:AcrR family transcriptional regulator